MARSFNAFASQPNDRETVTPFCERREPRTRRDYGCKRGRRRALCGDGPIRATRPACARRLARRLAFERPPGLSPRWSLRGSGRRDSERFFAAFFAWRAAGFLGARPKGCAVTRSSDVSQTRGHADAQTQSPQTPNAPARMYALGRLIEPVTHSSDLWKPVLNSYQP